ncbi:uncharacterized protein A1O9_04147 [Exophiala aquamarina CBS 119918]|uniref:AAA+ ATPase domain-containing protein n=1 Tax=Exophiala aquamarina CBS 119918 TaxID=1182545 RepID=A0A072PJ45_9EURO|nr:uncharacterized protein A1O9_04147 [Exophiala aquamarina CBS 119918]KEF59303.1 hypothetical protein A1O9_04147 [Exophiala aquamarina CBS 119918]
MSNFFDNKARAAAAKSDTKPKSSAEHTVAARAQPWVEKYRPKSLDEVKSQEHATETLRRMVNANNLPHLLLYGPPGSGKTSAILALCRELFGPELYSSRVLELNASDERSITVVRERIKTFAALHLVNAPTSKEYRERYPCPSFKVIVLDEADQLSQDAQGALRRVIEIHSKITRFALCCNYVSRVIAPLASRCSKFRFKALEGPQAIGRVADILKAENVSYDQGVIERSLKVSDGDLRRAINLLQSAARLVGAGIPASNGHTSKSISDDSDENMGDDDNVKPVNAVNIKVADIDEISGVFPMALTDHLLKTLQKGNTRNYNSIAKEIADITASGYSANEVLLSLYNKIVFDELVDNKKKYQLTQIFSDFDRRLIDGVDEQLSVLDLSCQIAGVLAK